MKRISFDQESLKEAVKILKNGGVIAHPADTCYGLAADFLNENAVKKLQAIKGRNESKPMSIMLPAFMKPNISKYAKLDDFSESVCESLLPGPVTIVLPKSSSIPEYFFPETSFIGIRIPYNIDTQDLLTAFGGALITTSANISGSATCCTCNECADIFKNNKNKPDVLFEGTIKNACIPSTVIKIENRKVKILREGLMTKKQLEEILRMKIS